MTCPNCGEAHLSGQAACDRCGHRLDTGTGTLAGPAESPSPDADVLLVDADEQRRRQFTQALTAATPNVFVTPALIAINVLLFAAMVARGASVRNPASDALVQWGAAYGPLTTHGQWWRLLTAVFVHIGVVHLLMNMFVLWIIGRTTERLFGNAGFIVLYLGAGLAGSLTSLWWHPLVVAAGASGAIFGLYGGLFGFLLIRRASMPADTLATLLKSGVFFVAGNLLYGFIEKGVDVSAHLGGFVIGIPLGCALAVPLEANRASRLRRSLLVALSTVALAGVVAGRMPATGDLSAAMNRLAILERQSTALFEGSLDKMRTDAMTGEEFARLVDAKLLPAWNAERTTIITLSLPEPQRTTARQVGEYMALKAEAWRLTAEGLRTNDAAMLRNGTLKMEAALYAWQAVVPDRVALNRLDRIKSARATADAFAGEMEKVTAAEQNATKVFNDSLGRLKAGRITSSQFAGTIETQVLRPWSAERETLSSLKAPEGQEGVAKEIVRYMSLREEGWRLASQAIQSNDPGLLQKAAAKQVEASNIARSITAARAAAKRSPERPHPRQ